MDIDVDALPPSERARFEDSRARDFYRYYAALEDLAPDAPQYNDLNDPEATHAHRPRPSPDRTLTAFCQLAALRIASRRAMLFFFDNDYAYILAEATRTLPLGEEGLPEIEDNLWLGRSIIPRGFSVCEHTVNIPQSNRGSNATQANAGDIHIINNLPDNVDFCDRPFVLNGPKARFYAGVPIITPRGNRIGALCILDDKPRDGLDDHSIDFLVDLSRLVMDHLESIRMRGEHRQGMTMIQGLSSFVNTANARRSSLASQSHSQERAPVHSTPIQSTPSAAPDKPASTSTRANGTPQQDRPFRRIDSSQASSTSMDDASHTKRSRRPKTAADRASAAHAPHTTSPRKETQSPGESTKLEIHRTFQRAARLLYDSSAVDGVAFLDASKFHPINRTSSYSMSEDGRRESFASTSLHRGSADNLRTAHEPIGRCAVLGAEPPLLLGTKQSSASLDGEVLLQLLSAHPTGKIWSFESSPHEQAAEAAARSDGMYPAGGVPTPSFRSSQIGVGGDSTESENRVLQIAFPKARSVAMMGLWDHNRGQWSSACFMWTESKMRVFSEDSEIDYLSALGDVIMGEISRIQSRSESRAKSDFISSISHELRSPLHGILGTIDFMRDLEVSENVATMLDQVETCGQTLLEIINHLLDFTKLSHLPDPQRNAHALHNAGRRPSAGGRLSALSSKDSLVSSATDVALDKITEDIVQTAVYSFRSNKERLDAQDDKVAVILDIQRPCDSSWLCSIPTGAWKRVCMNLVSNALKYTKEGVIRASLSCSTTLDGAGRPERTAIFSVEDSGCGMSQHFVDNLLFQPFRQEDQLVDGLGLGMSIVHKIVAGLGGHIQVESERDVGTTIGVVVPMSSPSEPAGSNTPAPPSLSGMDLAVQLAGQAPEARGDDVNHATQVLIENLSGICGHLGIRTRRLGMADATKHSAVTVVAEHDLLEALHGGELAEMEPWLRSLTTPLVALCSSPTSARTLKHLLHRPDVEGQVHFILQPCGPWKLARLLRACAEQHSAASTSALTEASGSEATNSMDNHLHTANNADTWQENVAPCDKVVAADLPSPDLEHLAGLTISPLGNPTSPTKAGAAVEPMQLLLCDDNPINLRILEMYAKKNRHGTALCYNGLEAVETYQQSLSPLGPKTNGSMVRPRVIFMDINMPVMDGLEASRRIRALEAEYCASPLAKPDWQPVIIIAITAVGAEEMQEAALESGVDIFLTKPIRPKELTVVLAGALALR